MNMQITDILWFLAGGLSVGAIIGLLVLARRSGWRGKDIQEVQIGPARMKRFDRTSRIGQSQTQEEPSTVSQKLEGNQFLGPIEGGITAQKITSAGLESEKKPPKR